MPFEPRTKFSAPPNLKRTDADRAALRSLLHAPGFPVILDILHVFAIRAEIEVYTAVEDAESDTETMQHVRLARAAWIMLDYVQREIAEAEHYAENLRDEAAQEAENYNKVIHPSNEDFLKP
jgi:hypothetical protein